MTTMTYAEAINFGIKALGASNPEAVERLTALKAQLAKRSGSKGLTKAQKLNETLKGIILEILGEFEDFVPMADLMADERLPEDISVQKMGALLGQLVKAEQVVKVVHKKRTLYAVKGVEFVAPDAKADEGEDA